MGTIYARVGRYVVALFTDKSFNMVSYVGKSPTTQKTDKIHTTGDIASKTLASLTTEYM